MKATGSGAAPVSGAADAVTSGAAVCAAPLPMKSIQLRFSSEAVWPGLRVMTNSSCVPAGTPVSGSETSLNVCQLPVGVIIAVLPSSGPVGES